MTSKDIYDAGLAIMQYNINNDRMLFKFGEEEFDFMRSAAVIAWNASFLREEAPLLRVCDIEKLREIAAANPGDCK